MKLLLDTHAFLWWIGYTLISVDQAFQHYPVKRIWS
jgi:PIN domain nuclease of toxin-antitoxin system